MDFDNVLPDVQNIAMLFTALFPRLSLPPPHDGKAKGPKKVCVAYLENGCRVPVEKREKVIVSEDALPQRIAFVGDCLPRLTFTHDLSEAVACAAPDSDCFVGAVNDRSDGYGYPARVHFELQEKGLDSYRRQPTDERPVGSLAIRYVLIEKHTIGA